MQIMQAEVGSYHILNCENDVLKLSGIELHVTDFWDGNFSKLLGTARQFQTDSELILARFEANITRWLMFAVVVLP
jgi:hypothetical protein